jgi:energy-coupling factor transport system substrate-specific component
MKRRISLQDLVLCALFAALGFAFKLAAGGLIDAITVGIPGGSVAGGIYMLFPLLARGLTGKSFTASITGVTQALLALVTGIGGHGVFSLLTYTVPALIIDIVFLLRVNGRHNVVHFVAACTLANMSGAFMVNLIYFNLPALPLTIMLFGAAASGIVGGLLGFAISKRLKKNRIRT